jgi:hypothetical protein
MTTNDVRDRIVRELAEDGFESPPGDIEVSKCSFEDAIVRITGTTAQRVAGRPYLWLSRGMVVGSLLGNGSLCFPVSLA